MDRSRFERLLAAGWSRRHVLAGTAGLAVAASLPGHPTRTVGAARAATRTSSRSGDYPFTLGVASGDPVPGGIVLWTRLAPAPLVEDGSGGMEPTPVIARWEVATDDAFRGIVQAGAATATPELAHSIHVDVAGLEPARAYFYRFLVGSHVSPVGRTKTAPAANARLDRLRFAFASCQDYQAGYYPAYRHLVEDDLDLVVFLGDYIYEAPGDAGAIGGRTHLGGEPVTLGEYRLRHAQYKTDPDLQAAHTAFPWVVTWDDHEVDNDYAGAFAEDGWPVPEFLARRAAAYQAYYEHMPLRPASLPRGPEMLLYRRLTFGDLATFAVLDTRQYRSDPPCGRGERPVCPAALDSSTTMLGPAQERWLLAGLDASTATWNIVAQQVLMAQLNHRPAPQKVLWTDAWDGYLGARHRLLTHLASRKIANPVMITGDWHCAFVNDLKLDFDDPAAPTIGTEFVVTSISSMGDTTVYGDYYGPMIPWNPHIQFFADRRGYQRVELTPEHWRTDLRMVETVSDPAAAAQTLASYVIETGLPGAVRA
jgi:alkaline phosphatase D